MTGQAIHRIYAVDGINAAGPRPRRQPGEIRAMDRDGAALYGLPPHRLIADVAKSLCHRRARAWEALHARPAGLRHRAGVHHTPTAARTRTRAAVRRRTCTGEGLGNGRRLPAVAGASAAPGRAAQMARRASRQDAALRNLSVFRADP